MLTWIYVLIVATYVFTLLGAIAVLLLGVSFTRGQRKKYRFLRWLDGKQVQLTIAAVTSMGFAFVASVGKDILTTRSSFTTQANDAGVQSVYSTAVGFDAEAKHFAAKQTAEARERFRAGERAMNADDLVRAATEYRLSLRALRTMSALLNHGNVLLARGLVDQAQDTVELGLRMAQEHQNVEFRGKFRIVLGNIFTSRGEFDAALARYRLALLDIEAAGKTSGRAALGKAPLFHNMGLAEFLRDNYPAALSNLEKALQLYVDANDDYGRAVTLVTLGDCYHQMGQAQRALRSHLDALSLIDGLDRPLLRARALNDIGIVYSNMGDLESALKAWNESYNLYKERDQPQQTETLINIGTIYYFKGDQQAALTTFDSALAISQRLNQISAASIAANNVASVYEDMGDWQKGIAYYRQALALSRRIPSRSQEAGVLNSLADLFLESGRSDSADVYNQEAIRISTEIGHASLRADALNSQGDIERSRQNLQRALVYHRQALDLYTQANNAEGAASARGKMGVVYAKLGQTARAIELLSTAVRAYRESGISVPERTEFERVLGQLQPQRQNVQPKR